MQVSDLGGNRFWRSAGTDEFSIGVPDCQVADDCAFGENSFAAQQVDANRHAITGVSQSQHWCVKPNGSPTRLQTLGQTIREFLSPTVDRPHRRARGHEQLRSSGSGALCARTLSKRLQLNIQEETKIGGCLSE